MTNERPPVLERPGRLLERDDVIAMLHRIGDDPWDRMRGAIVLDGAAGTGKTALVNTARIAAATRGLTVLSARCTHADRDDSYAVARRLLAPRLELGVEIDVADVLMLRALRGATVPPAEEHKVLLSLTAFLARFSPVVVVVDDAHLADVESATWLQFLCRRLDTVDAHVVLSTSPRPSGGRLGPIDHLAAASSTRCFELHPLCRDSIATMLAEHADDAAIDAVARVTGGNPFLLAALLHDLHADPRRLREDEVDDLSLPTVARRTLARTTGLPAAAGALLQAVAVLGSAAEVPLAAALAAIDPADAERLADGLADLGILRPDRPLDFVHPLVRTSIHGELGTGLHAVEHAAAAALLAAAHHPAVEVGQHLVEAQPGNHEWACSALTAAARDALDAGDTRSALKYLERAEQEMTAASADDDLALDVALVRADIAARHETADAIALLVDAAERGADPARLLEIAARCVEREWGTSRAAAFADALERPAVTSRATRRQRLDLALLGAFVHPDVEHVRAIEPWLLAVRPGSQGVERTVHRMAETLAVLGDAAACADDALPRALEAIGRGGRPAEAHLWSPRRQELSVEIQVATFLLRVGHYGDAERRLAALLQHPASVTSADDRLVLSLLAAEAFTGQGLLTPAADALQDARDAAAEASDDARERLVLLTSAFRTLRTGLAPTVERPARPRRDPSGLLDGTAVTDLVGRLNLAAGDPDAALTQFERSASIAAANGVLNPAFAEWRLGRSSALLAVGRDEEAAELAAANLELARAFDAPLPLAAALRGAARFADGRRRIALLEEAAQVIEPTQAEVERCRVLVAFGSALRPHDIGRSREVLRTAADRATRVGLAGLAQQARDGLRATGARPRRLQLSGAEALTPSERRVADLAAEGSTNTQISDLLCVSLKTVESHLSRTYRKLGVTSRAQLAEALDAGAVDGAP